MQNQSKSKMKSMMLDQSHLNQESDQNNNNENSNGKKNEKYSLRQRGQRKTVNSKAKSKSTQPDSDCDNSSELTILSPKASKEKPKQKAAPLSKYRRKTANARERTRMREINTAFESLRQSVPVVVAGQAAESTNEKLTKITTLRMAMKYMTILSNILNNKAVASEGLMAALMDGVQEEEEDQLLSAMNNSLATSPSRTVNNNILVQNHHDYCKEIKTEPGPPRPVKTKSPKVSPKKATIKAKTKKQTKIPPKVIKQSFVQKKQPQSIFSHNQMQKHLQESKLFTQLYGSFNNNNNISCINKYDLSQCLTPPNDDSPADLGLILESDGESLQLSEPCFSPLELGLLLESDGESLHLSEPCLSPLNNLDAFNDLLHSGFNEHATLEMYLS